MRFAYVSFVVLAASFSLIAAQTTNIEPTPSPIKIDLMQRPTPVYVLNFPEVQTVEGTVAVTNLPAVQTVGGTVNVGNLPLADDGSLRVGSAPARESVVVDLLAAPLTIPSSATLTAPMSVNTSGYTSFGILIVAGSGYTYARPILEWRWASDEYFSAVVDKRNGNYGAPGVSGSCDVAVGTRTLCNVEGAELRVSIYNNFIYDVTVQSIRIYLIP